MKSLNSPPPAADSGATATPVGKETQRRWLCLTIALVGPFLGVLDLFVVNVALPSIRASLGATFAQVELVVAGYGLAYAVCLITSGRLGDMHGRKRLFLLGLGAFIVTSIFCGFAPTAGLLIFWRVMQGASAAVMYPQAISFIQVLFTGSERRQAFSLLGVALGLGSILGQSLGGFLVEANLFGLGWRSVFLINLPIGLLALWLAARWLPESRVPVRHRLDLGGVAIVSLGLFLFTYPLVEGREQGWPVWSWLMLAAAAPALWFFYRFEQRKFARDGAGAALVEPALFQDRAFTVGLVIIVIHFAGHACMLLMLSLYFQLGLELSPARAGWLFVPFSSGFLFGSLCSGKMGARLGRGMLHLGAGIVACGLTALIVLQTFGTGAGVRLECALVVYGIGRGFMNTPLYHTVLSEVAPIYAGAAGGVMSTAQQVAQSAGLAAVGAVLFSALPSQPVPADYGRVFTLTSAINLGLLGLVSTLILFLPKHDRKPVTAAAVALE